MCKTKIDIGNSVTLPSVIIFNVYRSQKKREKRGKNLFEEIIDENYLNLEKKTEIQIQEAERSHNKINSRSSTPRHRVTKMAISSNKENFRSRKKKEDSYIQGKSHKAIS